MKKSRKLSLIGITSLMALTIVGCGGGSDDGHRIIIWTTFNDQYGKIISNAIQDFQAKYKNLGYKITYKKQNGSYDDLKSMVTKGASTMNIPDLVVAYPDSVADFLMSGVGLDVQPYMESEEEIECYDLETSELTTEPIGWTDDDFADIPEEYIGEGQNYVIPGTYSLPLCKSTEAMYYNHGVLVGLDLSGIDDEINDGEKLDEEYLENLTWDELFDHLCPALIAYNEAQPAAGKIMKPAGKASTTAVLGVHSDDNLFITLAEQYGLGYTAIENYKGVIKFVDKNEDGSFKDVAPGYYDLMDKFGDAYRKGYITTTGSLGESASYLYTGGGMLFTIGSTGGTKYAFDATNASDSRPAMIPQVNLSNKKVINQGPSLAFLKRNKGDAKQMATRALGTWLFYKELTNYEHNVEWSVGTGYAPVRLSVSESQDFLDYCDISKTDPNSLERLNAYTSKYVATAISSYFSNVVYYGSSKARSAVAGIMADCLKAAKTNEPGSAAYHAAVKGYFETGYGNAI